MRSVGYSDLFVLSKKDMWDVLKEYPAARVRLEAIAVKRLEKYKRAPLEKGESSVPSSCRISALLLLFFSAASVVFMLYASMYFSSVASCWKPGKSRSSGILECIVNLSNSKNTCFVFL